MRLVAVHDEHGTISMLLTSPADAPLGEPGIERGQIKTEVEMSGGSLEPGESITVDHLKKIIESYRVERGNGPEALGRLARLPAHLE